ncbi:hypothetical protein C8J57DRAFT_1532105 [Mycena rebaudengoi]|nr:hypothetical protein C8J57DRAFT_1532105 [Mycena rebaudengoi]
MRGPICVILHGRKLGFFFDLQQGRDQTYKYSRGKMQIVKTAAEALELWNGYCLRLHLFLGTCPSSVAPTASIRASSPIYISDFSDDELDVPSSSRPAMVSPPAPSVSTAQHSRTPPPPYSALPPSAAPQPHHRPSQPRPPRRPAHRRHPYTAQTQQAESSASSGTNSRFEHLHAADAFSQMGDSPESTGHWGLRGVNVIFASETDAVEQMRAHGLPREDLMGTTNARRLEVFVLGKPYIRKAGDAWGDHDEWERLEYERRN